MRIAVGDPNRAVRTALGDPAEPAVDGSSPDSFERLPVLVFRREPESPHPFAWIGGACAEIAGLPSHALTGDVAAWWERVPSQERERALAAMKNAHSRGSSYRVVYAYSSPVGSRRTLREEARAVVDADGRVLGFEGVIVDVSEEHAAFEKLRERERQLKWIVGKAPIVLFALDEHGTLTELEGQGSGVPVAVAGDAVGWSVFDLYAEFPDIVNGCRQVLAGEAFSSTLRLGDRFYQTDLLPRVDESGRVRGAIGFSVDVSKRERALVALRESEKCFRTLTENSPRFVVEVTAEARILYTSPRFSELLDYGPKELVGTNLEDLVHPDERKRVEADRAEAIATMTPAAVLVRVRHRNGSWRWVEVDARPYQTASGEIRGVLVGNDVTERERATRMLREQLEGERQVADLAQYLLTLGLRDLDSGIEHTLETAGILAEADRVRCVAVGGGGRFRSRSYQWAAPGIEPSGLETPLCVAGELRDSPWTTRQLSSGEVVHVPRVDDLPEDAAPERDALTADGVRSYLAIPLLVGDRIEGFLDFSRVRGQKIWSDQEITRLRLIAEVLASAIRGRRAEEAIAMGEERFRALTEHAGDAICEASVRGEILYVSPSFEEMFGYSREDLNEIDAPNLVHPEDIGVVAQMRGQFDQSRSFRGLRLRIRHRHGSWRWIEATARGFLTVANERRVAVVVRDVTERQRTRERLEKQLARETQIADLARGFLALSAEKVDDGIRRSLAVVGSFADADRSWLNSFNGPSGGITDIYEWCADDVEPHGERVRDATRHRFTWSYQFLGAGKVMHVPDTAELPEEAKAERDDILQRGVRSMLGIPLLFGERLIGYLGFETVRAAKTWSDESITILRLVGEILMSALRRKRAEEELVESQRRLLQAQKMEAVGTLAGGIAHDFNNQLTVMLGNARYVQSHMRDDPNLRDAMIDLTHSAEHCAQLTSSLLAFSRRSSVSPTSLDVSTIISKTRELIQPLIPSSIEFEVSFGEGVEPVSADPIQLQQVLVNLVVNARDAMPDGGKISVATANRRVARDEATRIGLSSPGGYVEIAVSDNGMGMDEETCQRVFEPFFTTKALGHGTGLGLATAYGIVQESGGAIALETELGRGTTFRLLLPRAASVAVKPEVERASASLEGSETLLLVEDERSVRRFVARALEERGYSVLEAENGEAGLRLGQRSAGEIDLLVTDLDMPGLNGLDLARQLRVARPALPVLLLSGYARDQLQELHEGLGGVLFLQKPFGEETLLSEVRELLEGEKAI
jgi:PAS domain S-box-containing protein